MLGARRARKGGRASQPRISNSHFLLAVFFRVTHDGLNERGSTRSLDPKWLTCFLITSLNSCEFALFWSICQLVSVDLKMRTIWKKREVAPILRILAGFFAEILVSLVQLNLSTVYSLHLCPCFVQQFSSSSRRWEKLDPTPYVRIMQLIDHKVCRSSFVRSPLVRSFARRSANFLFLLLEQICNVQLPK